MAAILGVVIGTASVIGVSGLTKLTYSVGHTVLVKYKRKKEKKGLKEKLSISIDNVNFTNFVNVIYEIKHYDDKHKKDLYISVQKLYKFNENHINNMNNFKRRFDNNFTENQNYLRELIQTEISISLSLMKDRLDL